MTRVVCLIGLLCALGSAAPPQATSAQDTGETMEETPPTRWAGTVTNLFETLDPSSPIDGAWLRMPDDWTVQDVRLLRYGTEPVPIQHRVEANGTVLLTTEAPVEAPHELIVRVEVGNRPGTHRWRLTPFVTTGQNQDSLNQRRARTTDRITGAVDVRPPSRPEGSNRAVDLEGASAPLSLRLPPPLAPARGASFTVEFWMRTNDLDQVILSSWTGDEDTAYPLEFVVDPSGRLRFYCGQSGRHQALRSTEPVADGRWHHAAVVYDQAESRLHLVLDGMRVNSAQAEALPPGSGRLSLALGGRRSDPPKEAPPQPSFTGRLDELRIWPEARSVASLGHRRARPTSNSETEDRDGPLRLHFDENRTTDRLEWVEGARRVPTRLTFQSPLRGLQAQIDGQSVTLRWTAASPNEGPFLIERSSDGSSFTVVERLSPVASGTKAEQAQEITYTDENVPGKIVFYRVRQVAPNTEPERATGTIKIGLGAKESSSRPVELVGNFPNPFKTSSTIAYRVHESQPVTLTVWDVSGKRIATLADGAHEPGYYERTLDAGDLPSGTYFARLETPQGIQSHQMVLLK